MIRRLFAVSLLLLAASATRADDAPLLTVAEKSDYKATSRMPRCWTSANSWRSSRHSCGWRSWARRRRPQAAAGHPRRSADCHAGGSGQEQELSSCDGQHPRRRGGRQGSLAHAGARSCLGQGTAAAQGSHSRVRADLQRRRQREDRQANRPEQAGRRRGVGVRVDGPGDWTSTAISSSSKAPKCGRWCASSTKWDPARVHRLPHDERFFHRYTITYEGGRCPAGDAKLVGLVQDDLLPKMGKRLEKDDRLQIELLRQFLRDRNAPGDGAGDAALRGSSQY